MYNLAAMEVMISLFEVRGNTDPGVTRHITLPPKMFVKFNCQTNSDGIMISL